MHMHHIIAAQLQTFRALFRGDDPTCPLNILETGTIREDTSAHQQGDGWSTLAFAQDAHLTGGHVTSVDLRTEVADQVLTDRGMRSYATLEQGYSVAVMAELLARGHRYDVILLDSENDAQLTLHEFFLALQLIRRPGLLLVDDVVLGSSTVVKGHQLVPWLDNARQQYQVTPRTGNGFMSGVLSTVIA